MDEIKKNIPIKAIDLYIKTAKNLETIKRLHGFIAFIFFIFQISIDLSLYEQLESWVLAFVINIGLSCYILYILTHEYDRLNDAIKLNYKTSYFIFRMHLGTEYERWKTEKEGEGYISLSNLIGQFDSRSQVRKRYGNQKYHRIHYNDLETIPEGIGLWCEPMLRLAMDQDRNKYELDFYWYEKKKVDKRKEIFTYYNR